MKRRKVLDNTPPPWANLVNETISSSSMKSSKKEASKKPTTQDIAPAAPVQAEINTSSKPAPNVAGEGSTSTDTGEGVQVKKKRRKRKSRFDERPPVSDVSAMIPQPKDDPLAHISDPMVNVHSGGKKK